MNEPTACQFCGKVTLKGKFCSEKCKKYYKEESQRIKEILEEKNVKKQTA